MTKKNKILWLVVLMVFCCIAATPRLKLTLPRITKKPTANRALAGQLMQKPLAPRALRTNTLTFRYATNAHATFGWEIQTSDDLKTWTTLIYPVMEDIPTVFATNTKAFYRVKAHN